MRRAGVYSRRFKPILGILFGLCSSWQNTNYLGANPYRRRLYTSSTAFISSLFSIIYYLLSIIYYLLSFVFLREDDISPATHPNHKISFFSYNISDMQKTVFNNFFTFKTVYKIRYIQKSSVLRAFSRCFFLGTKYVK